MVGDSVPSGIASRVHQTGSRATVATSQFDSRRPEGAFAHSQQASRKGKGSERNVAIGTDDAQLENDATGNHPEHRHDASPYARREGGRDAIGHSPSQNHPHTHREHDQRRIPTCDVGPLVVDGLEVVLNPVKKQVLKVAERHVTQRDTDDTAAAMRSISRPPVLRRTGWPPQSVARPENREFPRSK